MNKEYKSYSYIICNFLSLKSNYCPQHLVLIHVSSNRICNISVLQIHVHCTVHVCAICVLHGTVPNDYTLFALLMEYSSSYYCFCCYCHYSWPNLWQKYPNAIPVSSDSVPLYFFLFFPMQKAII